MSNATTASTARKVIYDTDPGVDDAMALYYALAHPGIDVVGITTTFGNVTVEQAATNGLYLTEIAGRKIPVTLGVKTPWLKAAGTPPDFIHGGDGLGNLPSRVATTSVLDPRPSAQFIVDMARAHPGEITLVAVGGYGRGELHPYSDIDLLILLDSADHEVFRDSIERFLTLLWDIGLEVGQSVRSVDECAEEARAEFVKSNGIAAITHYGTIYAEAEKISSDEFLGLVKLKSYKMIGRIPGGPRVADSAIISRAKACITADPA